MEFFRVCGDYLLHRFGYPVSVGFGISVQGKTRKSWLKRFKESMSEHKRKREEESRKKAKKERKGIEPPAEKPAPLGPEADCSRWC